MFAAERPIPGLPSTLFKVKDDGTVWRYIGGKWKKLKLRFIKSQHGSGSVVVELYCKRLGLNGKTLALPTLVLRAFGIPRPIGCETFHKDGNAFNNALSNLCWVPFGTSQQGKSAPWVKPIQKGERNCSAKLTEEDVADIKLMLQCGYKAKDVVDQFGISDTQVRRIATGQRWPDVAPTPIEPSLT